MRKAKETYISCTRLDGMKSYFIPVFDITSWAEASVYILRTTCCALRFSAIFLVARTEQHGVFAFIPEVSWCLEGTLILIHDFTSIHQYLYLANVDSKMIKSSPTPVHQAVWNESKYVVAIYPSLCANHAGFPYFIFTYVLNIIW